MKTEYGRFNVRMPKTLIERVDKLCAAKGITRNAAINMALSDWCAQQEKIDALTSDGSLKELMLELAKNQTQE